MDSASAVLVTVGKVRFEETVQDEHSRLAVFPHDNLRFRSFRMGVLLRPHHPVLQMQEGKHISKPEMPKL